ncbi:MAG TPA: ABC transporter ATP-binding protein [Candidatus Saccharimonadales bacterium]|nr:ABC transporter ATP-binding protein [Candidatus Saccharimonadales bacterium]
MNKDTKKPKKKPQTNIFSLLKPYKWFIVLLVVFTIAGNALSLLVPKIIASGIDEYTKGHFVYTNLLIEFLVVTAFIFIFTYVQSIVQTFTSERAAKDLREQIAAKISQQSYAYVQTTTSSKLLTNLTSDVDAVKQFIAQAIATLISSIFLIIGASILLLMTNWQLGLVVLLIVPIIGITFAVVLKKVRELFMKTQAVIDRLNKIINESILGAALIRVLNSEKLEYTKFAKANTDAKDIGLQILGYFATLIPIITFVASLASLAILVLGGHFVIAGSMSLGDFAAFSSYLTILIFPIIMIGFMSNVIAQSTASYQRIDSVLQEPVKEALGVITEPLKGNIEVKDISLLFGEKQALKDVSFTVKAGTRTAIIGPTAAGKTQLLYVLNGLTEPNKGTVAYDGKSIAMYDKKSLHQQVGFVFQDSIIFNMSLRENISFSEIVKDADLEKAIETAELTDFIHKLPKKLDTIVSERGTSLSGGQKQRIMLARALALNPKILLLDDFTARIDANTEKKILENVKKHYPDLTLLSVTQKIDSVKDYDQIILLMEGEVIAKGKHKDLMKSSPEYVQLYESQQSTSHYE